MNNLNYGVIGNGKSAALVSERGSIDWCCLPEFNSASCFGRLIDHHKGGHFCILVDSDYQVTQFYERNTNILVTRFKKDDHQFELIDFMPVYRKDEGQIYYPPDLIRYLRYISGAPKFTIEFKPALNYAAATTETKIQQNYIKSNTVDYQPYESIYLYSDLDYEKIVDQVPVVLNQDAFLLLSYNEKLIEPTVERAFLKLQRTRVYWLNWIDRGKRFKTYDPQIIRSNLVLRLLTFHKTGAILAAVTTSLPETIGEVRNWDYRFCWIRDASMIIRVLTEVGYKNEAQKFLNFILDVIPKKDERIQIMYGIRGEKLLDEEILVHLNGYENSRPVRIGNDAYKQKQHDIYGVLMDVIYHNFKYFHLNLDYSEDIWTIVRGILNTVEEIWKLPDQGIWEIRTEDRHFTFSKILCWVAADRGVKIAKLLKREALGKKWAKLRDEIREDIFKNAWNEEQKAFTQYYGGHEMDASNLLMEYYGFIQAQDPRYISTVERTYQELGHNGLMYRYKNEDDFGLPSSSFTICSFWMIQAFYKIGKKEKARKMFDEMLGYGNHLGLFSEDIDFRTGRLLGNFPQGYSHLALIETAMMISEGFTEENEILDALD
jgi:GH15 family glucan-1,4-alpha-glucosidase